MKSRVVRQSNKIPQHYELISQQLNKAGITIGAEFLKLTPIFEFMILDAAGCLPYVLIENIAYAQWQDHKEDKAALNFYHEKGDQGTKRKLSSLVSILSDRFSIKSDGDVSLGSKLFGIKISNQAVPNILQRSALFIAADDLSNLDLYELLRLKTAINAYRYYDVPNKFINQIIKDLVSKIRNAIEELPAARRQIVEDEVDKQYRAEYAVTRQEIIFHQLFSQLSQTFPDGFGQSFLADIMEAKNTFFNAPPSLKKAEAFAEACQDAISSIQEDCAKFDGAFAWYNDLHPLLQDVLLFCKAIVGILAAVTVVPALVVSRYSNQGFVGTFFKIQPDKDYALEAFAEGLFKEDGLVARIQRPFMNN